MKALEEARRGELLETMQKQINDFFVQVGCGGMSATVVVVVVVVVVVEIEVVVVVVAAAIVVRLFKR